MAVHCSGVDWPHPFKCVSVVIAEALVIGAAICHWMVRIVVV